MRRTLLIILLLLVSKSALGQPSAESFRQLFLRLESEQLLVQTQGASLAEKIYRARALMQLKRFTEAKKVINELEQLEHGSFSAPLDTEFYLARGRLLVAQHRFKLGEKNYREALRRAPDPERKLECLNHLTSLSLRLRETDLAKKWNDDAAEALSQTEDPLTLCHHLLTLQTLQSSQSQTSAGVASLRAARSLALQAEAPILATAVLIELGYHTHETVSQELGQKQLELAIEESLDQQNELLLMRSIRSYTRLSYTNGRQARFRKVLEKCLAHNNKPAIQQRLQISWADELLRGAPSNPKTWEIFEALLKDPETVPHVRNLAKLGKISGFTYKKEWDKARKLLLELQETSTPHLRGDRDYQFSPGQILMHLARLEDSRGNYRESLRLTLQAQSLPHAPAWNSWKLASIYHGLSVSLSLADEKAAFEQFDAGIEILRKSPLNWQRQGGIITMIAPLQINKSVDRQVLDPATFILDDYPPLAKKILDRSLSDPGLQSMFLRSFEDEIAWFENQSRTSVVADKLINKAIFLDVLNRQQEAKLTLERSFRAAKSSKNFPMMTLSSLLLARVDRRLGHSESSLKHLQNATQTCHKISVQSVTFNYTIYGTELRKRGQLNESCKALEVAIQASPETSVAARYQLARSLSQLGRPGDALKQIAKARETFSAENQPISDSVITSLEARLARQANRKELASKLYERSLTRLWKLGSPSQLERVAIEYTDMLLKVGATTRALEVAKKSLDKLMAWQALGPSQQSPLVDRVVRLLVDTNQHREALQYLKLSQSSELTRRTNFNNLRATSTKSQELLAQLQELKERLGRLQNDSTRPGSAAEERAVGRILAQTRREFFTKMADIKQAEPDFEALVGLSGTELSSIQSLIRPKTLLLECFPAKNSLYLFIIGKESFRIQEVAISRKRLKKLVEVNRALLSNPDSDISLLRQSSQELSKLLVTPYSSLLNKSTRLRIVPSGPLWNLSFAQLQTPDGQKLGQQLELSYLTSSDILKMLVNRTQTAPESPRALLVGPAPSAQLPHGSREVRDLHKLLKNSKLLQGSEATKSYLTKTASSLDLLHIATHSGVAPKLSESFIQLADGPLTVSQIYDLSLQPGALVVLSSCQTGVGEASPGKELTSLASAFNVTGATTVIASRWRVDDQATASFFVHFYKALDQGFSRGQALREARKAAASSHPHPYYWAGFSLLGDPR